MSPQLALALMVGLLIAWLTMWWVMRISYHLGRIADACEASNEAQGIGTPVQTLGSSDGVTEVRKP